MAHILIIEDEPPIATLIGVHLRHQGWTYTVAPTVGAARLVVFNTPPDLILLDWMLPDMSGIEYLRQLKRDKATQAIPVLMLTARAEEADKVRGLDLGADDYITKPFSPQELLARIRSALRRSSPHLGEHIIEIAQLRINPNAHEVSSAGQSLELTPLEYKLLLFLASHPNRTYSREQLLASVWGSNVVVELRTVDAHIKQLRKALGVDASGLIETVRGFGYQFKA